MSAATAFAQAKPIASGDILTYNNMNATQVGRQPITFVSEGQSTNSVTIDASGNRTYKNVRSKGNYTLDKLFTRIASNGKGRPAEEVFQSLQKEQLEPGMNWKTTVKRPTGQCGYVTYDYDVSTAKGPDLIIQIDTKDTTIPTIQVEFKASPSGGVCGQWTQVKKMLISPELWEIVSEEFVSDQRGVLQEGYKFVITSVKTLANQQAK